MRERKDWPIAWMNVARSLANDRSPDERFQVCAIIVPEDNTGILALGYNGSVRGLSNEVESSDPGKSGYLHAELNCIIKAPYHYPVKKYMYVTLSPCKECAKLIANANIARVIYGETYRDTSGLDLLRSAGIEVMSLDEANTYVETGVRREAVKRG